MDDNHNYTIDFLRGIAALMVCFFHFAWANSDYLSSTKYLKNIAQFGYLGVEIFFVISGFIIPYSLYISNYNIRNIKVFFIKRCLRIEPPYLISVALVIVLGYLSTLSPMYRGTLFTVDLTTIFLHIGYLPRFFDHNWVSPVYWSLAIEFQYYILIAFTFLFLSGTNKLINQSVLIVGYILSYFIIDERLVFHYIPLFGLGISIFQYKFNFINKTQFVFTILLTLCLVVHNFDILVVYSSLFAFGCIYFIKLRKSKIYYYLGAVSYSLYLIHVPIGSRLLNVSENFIINDYLRTALIFISILICIVFSFVYYLYIEKPFLRLSKKFTYATRFN